MNGSEKKSKKMTEDEKTELLGFTEINPMKKIYSSELKRESERTHKCLNDAIQEFGVRINLTLKPIDDKKIETKQ